jgi:hypothetical protein
MYKFLLTHSLLNSVLVPEITLEVVVVVIVPTALFLSNARGNAVKFRSISEKVRVFFAIHLFIEFIRRRKRLEILALLHHHTKLNLQF